MSVTRVPSWSPLKENTLKAEAVAEKHFDEPLAWYIHLPYCRSRCGYCDFNTYIPTKAGTSMADYLSAVCKEIDLAANFFDKNVGFRPAVASIFFGGGTPTMFTPSQLGSVIDKIRGHFPLEARVEITTEANPETLSGEVLAGLLTAQFNRLSIGMQSASEKVLKILDRVHTPGLPVKMANLARKEGFNNINLDLIFGTPSETISDWRQTLQEALSCRPNHISAYSLIVEPGTRLARQVKTGLIPYPNEDDLADKYWICDELLTQAGLKNYETSNWAQPGFECLHNLSYWLSKNWWGVGAGAHSHMNQVRWWNEKNPLSYVEQIRQGYYPVAGHEVLTFDQQHDEKVLLQIRLSSGLPIGELTDLELKKLKPLHIDGLVTSGPENIKLTRKGRLLADFVAREMLA